MIEKLEIKHLRTFATLSKLLNLSATAEALGISQQAVSAQLNRMREVLGDALFVRSGRGVVATAYARSLEEPVQQALAALQAIPLPAGGEDLSQLNRTLVISATDYTQRVVVAPLLGELRAWAPGVRLKLINIESQHLTRRMQEGEIDLALTTSAYVPTGLISEPLFVEQYRLYSSQPATKELSLGELGDLDFIVTSPGVANFKGSADDWFERQGIARQVALSVPSFFMAEEALRRTRMVAFLPARLAPFTGLHEWPLAKHPPGFEVVAACHPSSAGDTLLRRIIDWARKHFDPDRQVTDTTQT